MDTIEQTLIQNCQSGDNESFGQLYDLYIKKIYDFIYYKTLHKETAEDLTSKVFLKAWQSISRFNSAGGSFSAWLYQIARNAVIDHYRGQKNNRNIEDVWDLSSDEDLARDLDVKNKLADIEKYLQKLSTEQRDIIIMRVWQELSYQEIAVITGKNAANCKVIFSRAIQKLRQEMPFGLWLMLLSRLL